MMQLDLLSYTLTPEEAAEPPPQPKPINKHAIAYYEAKAALYLRLMNKVMQGDRLSTPVKRHEITRLHQIREQALARVKELQS